MPVATCWTRDSSTQNSSGTWKLRTEFIFMSETMTVWFFVSSAIPKGLTSTSPGPGKGPAGRDVAIIFMDVPDAHIGRFVVLAPDSSENQAARRVNADPL